jgi:hypothetical protein
MLSKVSSILPSGETFGFVSKLTDIQKDILTVLGIPQDYFNYAYLLIQPDGELKLAREAT